MTWLQIDGERCPSGIEHVVVLPVMMQHHRSGGATAPGSQDTANSDSPPPAGSDAQQFEDFCAQNPGAC